MARPSSKDPLDKFRWAVSIDGFTRLGFTQCDVPSVSIQTKKYAEGGAHLTPRQIVDSVEYKPVSLTRGVTGDTSFHDWAIQFMEVVKGKIQKSERPGISIPVSIGGFNGFSGNPQFSTQPTTDIYAPLSYRRDVQIHHLNREGEVVKTYTLINAFPIEYEPASSFTSDGDDMLSMEKLVLAYESFTVESKETDNNPFDIRDVGKRLIRRLF